MTSDWLNDNLYGSTNSITVVDKNKFFITQFFPVPLTKPEDIPVFSQVFFAGRNTKVYYCDYTSGKLECSVGADNFRMVNGICHSKDYSKMFISDW